jgi:diguanylate cyclase (GGDEF)-like protein
VYGLSAVLAGLAVAGAVLWVPPLDTVATTTLLVGAALVAVFALAESVVMHIEVGDSVHSTSLNDIPLVLALFWLPAPLVVAVRLLGAFLGLKVSRKQSAPKMVFNLCMMSLEAVVAVTLFAAVGAGDPGRSAVELWALATFVCLVTAVVTNLAIFAVIALNAGRAGADDLRTLLASGFLSAVGSVTTASLAVEVVARDVTATLPLLLMGAGITYAYRSHVRLRTRHDRLSSLYGFVRGVSAAADADLIVRSMLTHSRDLLRAEVAVLTLVDEEEGQQQLHCFSVAADGSYDVVHRPATSDDWPISRAISTGDPLLGQRGTRDRAVARHLSALGLRDCVLVVVQGEERPAGTLLVGSRRGEHSTFEPADVLALEGVAGHAAVALRNARLLDRLTHESRHDALTGLPNRSEFERVLAGQLDVGRTAAVLFMDLDRFKDVNDTLGHQAGDELLTQVAERLRHTVDAAATVSRLGGDEFAVLLPGTSAEQGLAVARQVRRALERPVDVEGMSVDVGVSIGLAVAPEHGSSASALMRRADVAMYDAKARDGVALYDATRDDSSTSRLALVAQLRKALSEDGFVLHYQPQVDAANGAVVRFEALIRWPSLRGIVPPDEFLPIAERAGLLRNLTEWVLRRSLDDAATWRGGGEGPGVAVNLSPRNLLEPGLAETVRRLLEERRLPADCLTLEITEGSVIAEPERALETLEKLRAIGIRLSVDDFGTGYSSLSYLRRLPVDEVKIDKSFVRGLADDDQDAAIVQAVVTLAASLSLTVVAEGVEDQAAWDRLVELGVDVVQGHHISRPVPLEPARAWLAEQPVPRRSDRVTPLFGGQPRPRARA